MTKQIDEAVLAAAAKRYDTLAAAAGDPALEDFWASGDIVAQQLAGGEL